MNRRTSFKPLTLLILTLTLPPAARAGLETITALSGFDPVALTQVTEIKGKEELQATRGRYRYLFANAENKKTFEAAPGQYGIQFDGYCMKMGPLSGRGSPDRWFVSGGRIYLFASESCRNTFKSDPAAFTDRADPPAMGSDTEKKRGRELIELALKGFGGAEKVDALKSVRWETITTYEQEGKKTEMRQATTVVLPARLRLDYSYGEFSEGHALANGRLVEVSGKGEVTPLPPEVYEFVRRRLYREPLALLRVRGQPDFVAVGVGSGEVNGQKVDWVSVSYAGATTKLGIDPKSGRIFAAVYRGRTPSKLGEVSRTYLDFKEAEGGLILPQDWKVAYDGQAPPARQPVSRSVALNVPVEARMFPTIN